MVIGLAVYGTLGAFLVAESAATLPGEMSGMAAGFPVLPKDEPRRRVQPYPEQWEPYPAPEQQHHDSG